MTRHELVPATMAHAESVSIAATDECVLANLTFLGMTPLEAMGRLISASREPITWLADGEPACVIGVASYVALSTTGYPWIFYTPLVRRHKVPLLRHCRRWLELNLEQWHRLEAYVDAGDKSAVRWMRFMGFTLEEPEPRGTCGLPFHLAHADRTD